MEIASFLSPVAGETSLSERIRERIEFSSNLLFLIEDLYLAIGPGYMVNQSSSKIDVRSPLYWVRNQLANQIKELMIAKRTGWQVLKNLKNQVSYLYIFILFFNYIICVLLTFGAFCVIQFKFLKTILTIYLSQEFHCIFLITLHTFLIMFSAFRVIQTSLIDDFDNRPVSRMVLPLLRSC